MNTFELSLDLDKSYTGEPVRLRQGDKRGTVIRATIYDHGEPFTGSYTARYVQAIAGTGHEYYRADATFAAGVATVTVNEEYAAAVAGNTYGYFQFVSGSTVIASTQSFPVIVLQDATAEAEVGERYDSAIEDALAELDEATGRISQMVQDATAEYLEAHPELTTTVEDNSLTDAKLVQHGGILDRVTRLWHRLDNLLTATPAESDALTVTDAAKTPLAGLALYGRSTQDGTPTPSAPVPIVSVEPDSDGNISLLSKRTSDATQQSVTPIDLQGHALRSLPDGTRDEVTVDVYGHAVLTQRVGSVTLDGSEKWGINGSTGHSWRHTGFTAYNDGTNGAKSDSFLSDRFTAAAYAATTTSYVDGVVNIRNGEWVSVTNSALSSASELTTWLASNPMTLTYKLAEPQTIDLGTIDPVALQGPDMTAQAVPTAPFALTYERDLNVTLARLEASIAELATN